MKKEITAMRRTRVLVSGLGFCLALGAATEAWAAPIAPSTTSVRPQAQANSPATEPVKQQIVKHLHQKKSLKPFYNELAHKHGGAAVKPLLEIALNERNSDEVRWAALFGLGRVAGKESLTIVRRFMTHSSWMLRDAALKTAAALNAQELVPNIEARLRDDALIVRTTAVQALGHMEMKKSAPKLVEALFDPANYNGTKALWIHKHILEALAKFHYEPAVPRLVELLQKSKDEKLQANVVATLEQLTGKSFPGKPMSQQIFLWKRNTMSDVTY